MKCQNCGFETEQNYCPMCGTKVAVQQNEQNFNQYVHQQRTTPAFTNIPENNQTAYPQSAPPKYPSVPPTPPQNISAENSKSGKKALTIVLSCLLAAVITAGIIINIYSACVI